jgi:hypothetical protein
LTARGQGYPLLPSVAWRLLLRTNHPARSSSLLLTTYEYERKRYGRYYKRVSHVTVATHQDDSPNIFCFEYSDGGCDGRCCSSPTRRLRRNRRMPMHGRRCVTYMSHPSLTRQSMLHVYVTPVTQSISTALLPYRLPTSTA